MDSSRHTERGRRAMRIGAGNINNTKKIKGVDPGRSKQKEVIRWKKSERS